MVVGGPIDGWRRVVVVQRPPDPQGTLPAPISRTASAVAAAVSPQPTPVNSEPRHPVPAASDDAADAAIPALAQSDAAAWQALLALVQDDDALSIVLRKHLIERVVVMIDNLTQPSISRRASVLQPVPGELQVSGEGDHQVLDQANAARYAPYVAAFTGVDAQAMARSYVRFTHCFSRRTRIWARRIVTSTTASSM